MLIKTVKVLRNGAECIVNHFDVLDTDKVVGDNKPSPKKKSIKK